jgi:methylphosphotriester-DNA--protein-cysteine methyltransferase
VPPVATARLHKCSIPRLLDGLRIEPRLKREASDAHSYCGRGDLSVTEVCFAVVCSSLGTFSSRFTGLVGMPPRAYRNHGARATAAIRRAS